MKRVMLLALLAVGLPTAALATSMDFATGTFASGTLSGSFTTTLNVKVAGSLDTISIVTGTLMPLSTCQPGASCFMFTGGSVTVWSPGGSQIFTDTLSGGLITKDQNAVAIAGGLTPGTGFSSGVTAFTFNFNGGNIVTGSAGVTLSTPEPGTLGLLGTGLIGLAAMIRRKLKMPT